MLAARPAGRPGGPPRSSALGYIRSGIGTPSRSRPLVSTSSVSAQSANAPAKALSPLEQKLMSAEKSFVEAVKKGDVGFFQADAHG